MPSAADIEQLADWIASARAPVVITSLLGQDPRDAVVLSRLAERWALPVIPYNTRYFAISANHPMFQGSMPGPLLDNADLVIVIEADVPWLPSKEQPPAGARVVQIGEDPLYARYPMRSFPSDLTITASALSVLEALEQALAGRADTYVEERRARLVARSRELHAQWRDEAERDGRGNKITSAWLNHCLREVVDRDTIVVSEYSFRQEHCPLETPGSLFGGEQRRRSGLGLWRLARGEAGVAGPHGAVGAGRRRLHVRQSRPRATTSRRCRSCRC